MADAARPAGAVSPAEQATQAQAALGRWGIFGDEEKPNVRSQIQQFAGLDGAFSWTSKRVAVAVACCASLLVAVAGVLLQVVPAEADMVSFRWFYFASAVVPVFVACHILCAAAFHAFELYYFHELLTHYGSLIRALRRSLSMAILVGWQYLLFNHLWCYGAHQSVCSSPVYAQAASITTKVLLCLFVATLANLISAIVTKYASTHFYKSTHFKKLKAALEIEFQLRVLSNPRKKHIRHRKGAFKPHASQPISEVTSTRGQSGGSIHGGLAVTAGGVVVDVPVGFVPPATDSCRSSPPLSMSQFGHSRTSSWDHIPRPVHDEMSHGDLNSVSRASSFSLEDVGDINFELNAELLKQLPLEIPLDNTEDLGDLSEAQLERIRTTVIVKTYSSLIRNHKYRTQEEVADQLKAVKQFGVELFKNIRGPDVNRKYIHQQDMFYFYPDDAAGRSAAVKAFNIFSSDPKARVSKQEVVEKVTSIFLSRSDTAASLSDTESMMDSLETGLSVTLHFFFIAIYLAIWDVDLVKGYSTFVASILALSFIFGNSIRNLFESMLFLFIQHPYDIGDWVSIDSTWYEVKKIGLLNTVFLNIYDNLSTISNAALFTKDIVNLSRYPKHSAYFNMEVDIGIGSQVKEELTQRTKSLMAANKNDFVLDSLDVKLNNLTKQGLKVNIFMMVQYNMPVDDWRRKRAAADLLITNISDVLYKYQQQGAVSYSYHHKLEAMDKGAGLPVANLL